MRIAMPGMPLEQIAIPVFERRIHVRVDPVYADALLHDPTLAVARRHPRWPGRWDYRLVPTREPVVTLVTTLWCEQSAVAPR